LATFQEIDDFARRIGESFQPERVILFGSWACGEPTADSDVDLLVIMPFQGKAVRRAVEILLAVRPAFPIDLIVYTPEEAARRYQELDPLVREAIDRGRILYEGQGVTRETC
jgi:predicted nucleotidyltransferase